MKNNIINSIVLSLMILCGCKSNPPTVEQIDRLGRSVGFTTAYVMNNQITIDDSTRNAIISVMNEVSEFIPETNSTYTATWSPIAERYLGSLVNKDGQHLPYDVQKRVLNDFIRITTLLDKYIEKKEIKNEQDLVNAFVNAFLDSFLSNFKSVNMVSACENVELDEYTIKTMECMMK